jgi:hypothetical protein
MLPVRDNATLNATEGARPDTMASRSRDSSASRRSDATANISNLPRSLVGTRMQSISDQLAHHGNTSGDNTDETRRKQSKHVNWTSVLASLQVKLPCVASPNLLSHSFIGVIREKSGSLLQGKRNTISIGRCFFSPTVPRSGVFQISFLYFYQEPL